MRKELTRLKNEKYANRIKKFLYLRRHSLKLEKDNTTRKNINLQFRESKIAWELYLKLGSLFSAHDSRKIEADLRQFLNSTKIRQWKGGQDFKEGCEALFPKRGLTQKGVKYFKTQLRK